MPVVAVASQNPVKANAIRAAFEQVFPHQTWEMVTVSVASGVADQPMTDAETRQGARNRVAAARQARPTCDFWAAVEGGIEDDPQGMFGLAWIIIQADGRGGEARTASFPLPPPMAKLVRDGIELGKACDLLYEKENCKQHEGAIGLLSHQVIDRQQLYQHAAIMALMPLRNPDWYAAAPYSSS